MLKNVNIWVRVSDDLLKIYDFYEYIGDNWG